MNTPSENVVNTIYNYTERLLDEEGQSLTRIDSKIGLFIGYAGILIRLAYDLPHEEFVSWMLRAGVCSFCILSIILSALGLRSKTSGNVADPDKLMSDEFFFEKDETYYRRYIIERLWLNTKTY